MLSSRRRILAAVGTGTVGAIAGCTGRLVGGDGSETWPMPGRTARNDAHRDRAGSHDGSVEERWRWAVDEPGVGDAGLVYSSPVALNGTLFVRVSGTYERPGGDRGYVNRVVALDAADGTVVWTHEYEPGREGVEFQSAVFAPVVVDDAVVVTGVDRLYALDPGSGERRWVAELPGFAEGPPVAADGTVFLNWRHNREGRVVAFDVGERRVRWESEPPITRYAGVAVTDDAVVVPAGSAVVARDRGDGSERWRHEADLGTGVDLDGRPSWPHTPLVAEGTVYVAAGFGTFVGRDAGALVALDAADGDERWRFRPRTGSESLPAVYGRPLSADGTVYVCGGTRRAAPNTTLDPRLYGVDPADGSLRTEAPGRVGLDPVGAGSTGYVANAAGVQSFTTGDGEPAEQYRFDAAGRLTAVSPPAVVGEVVVVPTGQGLVAVGPS